MAEKEREVSIHAPVKVRPRIAHPTTRRIRVSIHAPVKVRHHSQDFTLLSICFNSRTREGATAMIVFMADEGPVSIHAPVKVRRRSCLGAVRGTCFNSRTREGATERGL